jgi:hypothetical protein
VAVATTSVAASERVLASAKTTFDAAKTRLATLTAELQGFEDVKKGIETAEDANDPVGMYVGLREYDRQLAAAQPGAETGLKPVEGFQKDLEDAWRGLQAAQNTHRDATAQLTDAQNRSEAAKAELDRLGPARVAEVVKLVVAGAGASQQGGSQTDGGGYGPYAGPQQGGQTYPIPAPPAVPGPPPPGAAQS